MADGYLPYLMIFGLLIIIALVCYLFGGYSRLVATPDEPLFDDVCEEDSPKICQPELIPVEEATEVCYTETTPEKIFEGPIVPADFQARIDEYISTHGLDQGERNANQSKGEAICCQTMTSIYGEYFVKTRPAWLVNPETNRRLELDCYNDRLKIAVEYNGVQHYEWPNFTGQTQEEFIKQVRRDQFKRERCEEEDVYLITVPYTVPLPLIREYLLTHVPENVKRRIIQEQGVSYSTN